MRWDDLFADMEAQLDAAAAADLVVEVAERTRVERATIPLADRLRAARGATVVVRTRGGEQIEGILADSAAQWVRLDTAGRAALVPLAALTGLRGLGRHAVPAPGVVERRLTLGHALRALARDRTVLQLATDGGDLAGRVERVGADHLDLLAGHGAAHGGELWTVPFSAVRVVRSG